MARLNHTTYAAGIPLTFIDGIDIPDLPDYGGINMEQNLFVVVITSMDTSLMEKLRSGL